MQVSIATCGEERTRAITRPLGSRYALKLGETEQTGSKSIETGADEGQAVRIAPQQDLNANHC